MPIYVFVNEHQDRSNRTVVKVQHPKECESVVLSKYHNKLTRLTIELWVGQFCVSNKWLVVQGLVSSGTGCGANNNPAIEAAFTVLRHITHHLHTGLARSNNRIAVVWALHIGQYI